MRVLKLLVATAVLVLAITVVIAWTLPASVAWKYLSSHLPMVQLEQVGGSVWDGHAEQLRIAGQPLGKLRWQTEVLPLLHGDLRLAATIDGESLQGSATVTRKMNGVIVIHDGRFVTPGALLQGFLQRPDWRLGGQVHVEVRQAHIRNTWPVLLDATARWQDVTIHGSSVARLGTIVMQFSEPEPPAVEGSLKDGGNGPLQMRGTLTALPTGFHLQARLRARDPDDLRTRQALLQIGQPQADGSVLLQAEGTLF